MLASEIIARYEAYCPQELSMEGDISGLQIGTLDKEVDKVLVALDIREQTVAEAIEAGAGLIIVKHAPIFRPLKDLVADKAQNQMILDLIKHDIAVYVSHTNIDVVEDGLNDWFCQLLEIEETVRRVQITVLAAWGGLLLRPLGTLRLRSRQVLD
mgnify:CR=1 FL=1